MILKIKKMRDDAQIPQRATEGAAAADLCACLPAEGITINPGERVIIPTGIAIELPSESYVALVFARSGLGTKKGISLANGVGVIDSDYRGEVHVGLINNSGEAYTVQDKDRIAQLAVFPIISFDVELCEELGTSERGGGGFGSTGVK